MEEDITALLASVAGGRRYWTRAPAKLPDGTLLPKPYVVLNRVDGIRDYHFGGASGYVASRVQIDVYADTYKSAKSTARAVITTLSGHSGGDIQAIFVEGERDLPAADAGDVTNLFRTSIDIIVHHGEAP